MTNYPNLKLTVIKSDLQKLLESNGCRFIGQEALSNHEPDISKPCKCGRPVIRRISK